MYPHRTMTMSKNNPDENHTSIPQPQLKFTLTFASCYIYVSLLNENIRPTKSVSKKEVSEFYLKNVLQPEQWYPTFSCSKHSSNYRGNKHENLWTINFPPLLNKRLKAACYLYPAVIYLHTSAAQETQKLALSVNRWDAEWRQRRGAVQKVSRSENTKRSRLSASITTGFLLRMCEISRQEWSSLHFVLKCNKYHTSFWLKSAQVCVYVYSYGLVNCCDPMTYILHVGYIEQVKTLTMAIEE